MERSLGEEADREPYLGYKVMAGWKELSRRADMRKCVDPHPQSLELTLLTSKHPLCVTSYNITELLNYKYSVCHLICILLLLITHLSLLIYRNITARPHYAYTLMHTQNYTYICYLLDNYDTTFSFDSYCMKSK